MPSGKIIRPWDQKVKPPLGTPIDRSSHRFRDLLVWWPLLSFTGTDINSGIPIIPDYSGNDYHAGTNSLDASKFIDTEFGLGLHINSTSHIITTKVVAHNIGSGPFTMCAFVRPNVLTSSFEAICANGSFKPAMYTRVSTEWGMYLNNAKESGTSLEVGKFYALVATRVAGKLHFYRDGIKEPNTPSAPNSLSNSQFLAGRDGTSGNAGRCTILDVRWYKRSFSQADASDYAEHVWGEFFTRLYFSFKAAVVSKATTRMLLTGVGV